MPVVAWVILGLIVCLWVWLAHRGRGPVAEAVREHAHLNDRAAFLDGYRTALRDIEETGLKPTTDERVRQCAERAFRRTYIERP